MYASSGAGGGRGDAYKKNKKNASLSNIPPEVIAELVGSPPSEKNWKGVVIALGVIASILALIATAIVLLTPSRSDFVLGDRITFQEAMLFGRHLRQLQYQWLTCDAKDTLLYLNATSGDIMRLTFSDRNDSSLTTRFLSKDQFSEGSIASFSASADCKNLLIPVSTERRYRHSSKSLFKVVRIADGEATVAEATVCRQRPCPADGEKLQVAHWGPEGHFLVFVHDSDVYYTEDPLQAAAVRVTNNGGDPAISHGAATWVYEEEILLASQAVWVSPDSARIAFLTFNDSEVHEYAMPWYGSPASMYVGSRSIRYPKAGAHSPVTSVAIRVHSVKRRRIVDLAAPSAVPQRQHYVTAVRWFNASHLVVAWTDRPQIKGFLGLCSADSGVCRLFLSSEQPRGWMEFSKQTSTEPLMDPQRGRIFVVLHNLGYRRIAAVRVAGLNQITWISPNSYDVADILHHDAGSDSLHFLSCLEASGGSDATKMHVHRIAALQDAPAAACATCGAADCEFNAAAFSRSGRLLLHECLGPRPFRYGVRAARSSGDTGAYPWLLTLEDNQLFSSLLRGKSLPRVQFRRLLLRANTTPQARADPLEVNVKLVLPEQLNETHVSQYPLLLKVYAGPSAQMVTRKFDFGWQQYLASSLFVISASVDGRGTANRGSDFLFAIKNNFAKVEIEDQMDSLAELRRLQFVNRSSVGVFGWSYGGFAALHILGHPANANATLCATGVAVAPVTDFQYYNSGYTERYLGVKSEESAEVYKRTNVSALAHNFWNKDLLLAHGTGDDNVHYQNTAQLVKMLVQQNVDFELATYPDEAHSLSGSHIHLYQKITTFLLNSFNRTSERKSFLNSKLHKFCSGSPQAVC